MKHIYKSLANLSLISGVCQNSGSDWVNMTAFWDYLLAYSKIALDYAFLKKETVEVAKVEGKVYWVFKKKFI